MKKIKISDLPTFDNTRSSDRLFAHIPELGKLGYIPNKVLARGGVAMRRWNETMSTSVGEAVGDISYLRELPAMLGLGGYLVKDDRSKRKLSPTNHYFYVDGTPANLGGSEGQYMWCWNEFYYATWKEGNYTYEAISLTPIQGRKNNLIPAGGYSATGHGFIDRETNTLCSVVNTAERFRGGNGSPVAGTQAAADAPQTTMLGMPASSLGINTFSAYARKRGQGWEGCWFVARAAVEIIVLVVMGNRHTQSPVIVEKDVNGLHQGGFGPGVSETTDAKWNAFNKYYPLIPSSAGVELGDHTGSFEYDVLNADGSLFYRAKVPVFYGLKNFFGHLWFGVSGLLINATATVTEAYVSPSLYAGWSHASLAGMLEAAELPRASGYIKSLSMNLLCGMPTAVGGSAATYFADYFYENASTGSLGLRARFGGGTANSGTDAGAFCTHSTYAPTYATASRSVPLCFFEKDPVVG